VRRPAWSRRGWLLAAALGAPVLGLIGVTVAEVVPDGRIAAHLVAARQRGEIDEVDREVSLLGTTADHYAECVAVMIGLGDQPGNLVRRALYSASSYGCVPSMAELDNFAATGELRPSSDYMRYWHGYAVITRPALAIFGLTGTRWLAFGLLGLAIGAFTRAVAARHGALAAIAVLVPGLMTTDMIVGGWSIAQALGLATAWTGGWIVLTQVSRDRSWQVVALAAALGGAVSAYFDLMVAIPASLALCTVAAGLATMPTRSGTVDGTVVRSMGVAVGGWVVGLGAMWATKWILAWLLVDRRRIVDSVRSQISFRTAGEYEGVTGTPLNGFTKNFSYWLDRPLTPLVIAAAALAVAIVVWRSPTRLRWHAVGWLAATAAVVAVPVVAWYVILDNHNQIHFWQTYRSVAIAFGALVAVLIAAVATGRGDARSARYALSNGVDEAITSEPPEEQDATPEAIAVGERTQ
jgi:hypothetical protein